MCKSTYRGDPESWYDSFLVRARSLRRTALALILLRMASQSLVREDSDPKGEGLLTPVVLTRDRDLTHPQQDERTLSWGAKGSHVVGHAFSDEHDLWVLLQGAPFVLTKQCTGDSG